MTPYKEVGPIAGLPPAKLVEAARLVKQGRCFSLAVPRYPGMPLFPGHPPFQVVLARTPEGIRAEGAQPWGPPNDAGLGYMADYLIATTHSGAHIDALAHMTVGPDNHWYGGGNTAEHLTDKGPTVGDAEKLPPSSPVACCSTPRPSGGSTPSRRVPRWARTRCRPWPMPRTWRCAPGTWC